MASLWTPDGERPVSRPSASSRPLPDDHLGERELSDEERAQAEELARQMSEVREQLAHAPASVVVANHLMGFYELAAIHLSQQPPNFTEASVAIDALAAVLDKLAGRLGENEPTLRDARAQLQMAFVQLQSRAGDETDDVDGG